MASNQFFKKRGPIPLSKIIKVIGEEEEIFKNNKSKIYGLESLDKATVRDMTFLNSTKYKDFSLKTKAVACITSHNLSKHKRNPLPKIGANIAFLSACKAMDIIPIIISSTGSSSLPSASRLWGSHWPGESGRRVSPGGYPHENCLCSLWPLSSSITIECGVCRRRSGWWCWRSSWWEPLFRLCGRRMDGISEPHFWDGSPVGSCITVA